MEIETQESQNILNKDIKQQIEIYKNTLLVDISDELDFKYAINLKTGLGFKLIWKNSPFARLGNGERKEIALRVLYSYIKNRKKGPSILLIDGIENHFDNQMLINNLNKINNLPTALQLIITYSKKVCSFLDDYTLSIINKKRCNNETQEIMDLLDTNYIVF